MREAIYHDRNCYLEDGRPVGGGGGLGVVLATATAGAGRAEGTAAARAEREGLRGHAGRRVAHGESGGGCGARESLHWLVWGRREKERERGGVERKIGERWRRQERERESSARRLEDDGERGFGSGIFGGRVGGERVTCLICTRWIEWDPAFLFF